MEETRFCQSCAAPMGITNEHYGTNEDGTKNEDYCEYCYVDGKFKKDVTMNEMLEDCLRFKEDGLTEKQARRALLKTMPNLKRWKTAENAEASENLETSKDVEASEISETAE